MTDARKAKTKAAEPVSQGRVKSFLERIERLEEEKAALQGDIKDIYSEAKGVGYDTGTLRWLVRERKIDAADRAERDALRETYLHALGMAVELVRDGLSLREAGRITGASKSSIHRALAVPAVSHDHATGEVHESSGDRSRQPEGEGVVLPAPSPLDTQPDTLEIPAFLKRGKAA